MNYFLKDFELENLFRIRDSLTMLDEYGLADKELLSEVVLEIEKRKE